MNPDTIRQIRHELNLTQEQFAMLLDVGSATVRRWESGRTAPSRFQAEVIQAIYDKVKHRREQERIERENAEREKRQQEFVQGLLAAAAGGAFALMLSKIFSGNGDSHGESS